MYPLHVKLFIYVGVVNTHFVVYTAVSFKLYEHHATHQIVSLARGSDIADMDKWIDIKQTSKYHQMPNGY